MLNLLNLQYLTITRLALFSIFLASSIISIAQDREELEDQRFAIIEEIDNTNKLLQETAKNKKTIISDLTIIEKQIQNRRKLLDQIQKEITLIDKNIETSISVKEETEAGLDSLKTQYHSLLRATYREKAMTDPLISLLSAQSVSASFLKNNYFNRLKTFLSNKAEGIKTEQEKLDFEISILNGERNNKTKFLAEIEDQSQMLITEQGRQKVMVSSLKEDENSLKVALKDQKRDREKLNVAIENVINSKFGEAASISSAVNRSEATTSFKNLKGKLNWPVKGGVISSSFGKQRHPTLKNLTINNNGVDIRAPKSSAVKLVADGQIVGVTEMVGYGKTIIVEHQGYYSVYSKLEDVYVSKGNRLSSGDTLGKLAVKNNLSELHFEVWKDNQKLDPEKWLK